MYLALYKANSDKDISIISQISTAQQAACNTATILKPIISLYIIKLTIESRHLICILQDASHYEIQTCRYTIQNPR